MRRFIQIPIIGYRSLKSLQTRIMPSLTAHRGALSREHLLTPSPYSTRVDPSQPVLPRLPVPPLQQTLDRFLLSAQALLAPAEYKRATQLVHKFGGAGGEGRRLQKLLEEKAKNCINWLEEWWLNVAYLEYRLPVSIHVNPGIYTPRLPFRGREQQLKHAAKLIARVLEFKKSIDEVSLPVDKLGSADLCMKQFYRILGCCRVPRAMRDDVIVCPGGQPDSPRHVTILHNNHIFSLDVYDPAGHPLTSGQLFVQLSKIVRLSESAGPPIGILTTEHRDTWSNVYDQLCRDEVNERSLQDIQRSIFVLCLDNACLSDSGSGQITDESEINSRLMGQVNHGGGSALNTGNRWFDKILQVFVSPDGLVGFNYEHSAAEGPPIVQLVDHCYLQLNGDITDVGDASTLADPRQLQFNVSPNVQAAIQSASTAIDELIGNLSLEYYKFDLFGKDVIKSLKASPDAFIQVAFQLAYYRLHGRCVATYESGSLRKFQHGRTDTIRSCSGASKAYCEAMDASDVPSAKKLQLLRMALGSHRLYTDQVINGEGIDRHLLGLKLIALDNDLPVPTLLSDPVYEQTCHWQMSTSQVASRSGGLLCFAPVVDDGYGICYNPMDAQLLFAVSAWRACKDTDVRGLGANIARALQDAKELVELNVVSKL